MPIINMVYKKKKWWKPWANTIAYYPLTSETTVNDMSGNWHNLTASWTQDFWVHWWVDSVSFNWTQTLTASWLLPWTATQELTINQRFYIVSIPSDVDGKIWWTEKSSNSAYAKWTTPEWMWLNMWSSELYTWVQPIWKWVFSSQSIKDWYANWTILWDGINYSQTSTGAVNLNNIGTNFTLGNSSNRRLSCYVSNVIIENKARTAQEIANYYNLTKSNYGL